MSTSIQLPEVPLNHKPLCIIVKGANGAHRGKVFISQGGLQWWPRMAKRGIKISWARFERLMQIA